MYGQDILYGRYLWNSTQNTLPIHWKTQFLYKVEILRALRFKSSYASMKRPTDTQSRWISWPWLPSENLDWSDRSNPVVQWLWALTHLQGSSSSYEKNSALRLVPSNTAATGRFLHSATAMAWSMSCLGECPRLRLSDSSANWWSGRLLASFWNSVISTVSLEYLNRSCGNAWLHFM